MAKHMYWAKPVQHDNVMTQTQNSFWSERQGLKAGIQGLDMHNAAHLKTNQ